MGVHYYLISNELHRRPSSLATGGRLTDTLAGRPSFSQVLANCAAGTNDAQSVASEDTRAVDSTQLDHLINLLRAQASPVPVHVSSGRQRSVPATREPERDSVATSATGPAPGRAEIDRLISAAAKKHGVDPNLVKAVVQAESNFDPQSTSSVGAMGLMQLMPGTASELGVTNAYDARQNVDGGTRYLKRLLVKYNGDVKRALAAYNWGPGNVDRKGTSRLPSETRTYIKRVMGNWDKYAARTDAAA
jgi:soluble lytic murein transglycosylase-like protein